MTHVTGMKVLSGVMVIGLILQPLAVTNAQQTANAQITDIELKVDGSFQGKPVDSRGQIQANTEVTIQNIQTGQTIQTKTGVDGTFAITELPPGVYDITVGRMTSTVRIWPFQAAPAGSIQQVAFQAPAAGGAGGAAAGGAAAGGAAVVGTSGLLVGGAVLGVAAGIVVAIAAS